MSLTNASPLSLTLSLSQPYWPRPWPTLSHPLTLSLTDPLSCLSQSPSPPSHRHPVTLSTLTQSPFASLSLHYFTFISFAKRTEIISNVHHKALSTFSLRGLSKLKKKRWVASKCVSPFGCREIVGKIKETLVSIRFFLFWFPFWISNRTVKKDRSFIVFWDWIMFLGLFIFDEDLILVLCWSKFTLI